MFVMIVGWKVWKKTKFVRAENMDFVTDRYDERKENVGETDSQIGEVHSFKESKGDKVYSYLRWTGLF